jgi:hypothetical protein
MRTAVAVAVGVLVAVADTLVGVADGFRVGVWVAVAVLVAVIAAVAGTAVSLGARVDVTGTAVAVPIATGSSSSFNSCTSQKNRLKGIKRANKKLIRRGRVLCIGMYCPKVGNGRQMKRQKGRTNNLSYRRRQVKTCR